MGLSAVYSTSAIRALALSLLGIFTPLYILEVLNPLFPGKNFALMAVLVYFALLRLTILLINYPAGVFIANTKGGFRKAMLLANFLQAVNLLLLLFAKNHPALLLPAAITAGLLYPFFMDPLPPAFCGARPRT